MEALLSALKSHPAPAVLVFSLLFRGVHKLLQKLPVPKVVKQDDFRWWKWRNLSVSLVHSTLTGCWALTCAVVWPETFTDIPSHHTFLSYLLTCVSTGYFLEDAGDIILSGHTRASWEFLVHHALVLLNFGYALYTHMYISGVVIALFVEINSITLHLRLMLRLAGAKSSSMFYINKFVNLFTFVVFRMSTQLYLTWYLFHNFSQLTHSGYFLLCIMMMNVMILTHFYRLIRSDFFLQGKSYVGENGTHNSKKFLSD